IKGGPTLQTEGHLPTHDTDPADDLVGGITASTTNGHVVFQFTDALGVQEARDQDVGVGPVELFGPQVDARHRGDAKMPTLLVVENGREDARRVKARQTQPVDGTVYPHERHRVEVADYAVILDWLVRHVSRMLLVIPRTPLPKQPAA